MTLKDNRLALAAGIVAAAFGGTAIATAATTGPSGATGATGATKTAPAERATPRAKDDCPKDAQGRPQAEQAPSSTSTPAPSL